MPVKNIKRKTNDGFEGVITGLNDKEKEIISKSVGDKYITESTNKLILKSVNTNGNDFEVRTKDNDVVVSFTQNAPGDSSSYSLFDVIFSTAPNEDGEVYNIVARFTKDENWDAKLNLSASAGSIGAGFDITIPPDAYGNIAMASDLEPLKSDIAKAVKKDTDASLKSLTLPSAKDLKTKDGSSFGGGSKIYNGTEYLPTFDIATLKDVYLPLVGGTISGNLNIDEGLISHIYAGEKLMSGRGLVQGESIGGASYYRGLFESSGCGYYLSSTTLYLYAAEYNNLFYFGYSGAILSTTKNEGIEFRVYMDSTANNTVAHKLTINKTNAYVDDSPIVTQATLTSDLDTKQSTLYRHTITIYEGNTQDGNSICFTAYTSSNTAISSIEQLANTDLNCFGVSGTASALTFYNKIHIGTNLATTTLQKATGGSVALSSVYSTYTITDEHGPLN